jgi:hypothetical protein
MACGILYKLNKQPKLPHPFADREHPFGGEWGEMDIQTQQDQWLIHTAGTAMNSSLKSPVHAGHKDNLTDFEKRWLGGNQIIYIKK